jgi:hypothetical protein
MPATSSPSSIIKSRENILVVAPVLLQWCNIPLLAGRSSTPTKLVLRSPSLYIQWDLGTWNVVVMVRLVELMLDMSSTTHEARSIRHCGKRSSCNNLLGWLMLMKERSSPWGMLWSWVMLLWSHYRLTSSIPKCRWLVEETIVVDTTAPGNITQTMLWTCQRSDDGIRRTSLLISWRARWSLRPVLLIPLRWFYLTTSYCCCNTRWRFFLWLLQHLSSPTHSVLWQLYGVENQPAGSIT